MSNYTIELRFLNNPPMTTLFDFDYNYYMKDLVPEEVYQQKKKEFENKFLEFYYFDEIGYKTPDRFKQRLKNYLDMGFKKWQERYNTELEVQKQNINFLLNKDLTEERVTEGNATGNSSTTSSSTTNSTTTANNKNTVNDTPDTRFTEDSFQDFIKEVPEIMIVEKWITSDVRPGRGEEKWLNLILQKI